MQAWAGQQRTSRHPKRALITRLLISASECSEEASSRKLVGCGWLSGFSFDIPQKNGPGIAEDSHTLQLGKKKDAAGMSRRQYSKRVTAVAST